MTTKLKPVIPPTIGRRVLLFLATPYGVNNASVPFDAGICYVFSDTDPEHNCINVSYANHGGTIGSMTSVLLYDRAQNAQDAHGKGETYAVWMEYQFDQALRALQPKVQGVGAQRPPDVELHKLEENGVLTDLGRQRQAEGATPAEDLMPLAIEFVDDDFDAATAGYSEPQGSSIPDRSPDTPQPQGSSVPETSQPGILQTLENIVHEGEAEVEKLWDKAIARHQSEPHVSAPAPESIPQGQLVGVTVTGPGVATLPKSPEQQTGADGVMVQGSYGVHHAVADGGQDTGDGGVIAGTNTTTDGTIGQP